MHLCICKGLLFSSNLFKDDYGTVSGRPSMELPTIPSAACLSRDLQFLAEEKQHVSLNMFKGSEPYQKLICSPNSSKIDMSNSPEKRPCPGGFFSGLTRLFGILDVPATEQSTIDLGLGRWGHGDIIRPNGDIPSGYD